MPLAETLAQIRFYEPEKSGIQRVLTSRVLEELATKNSSLKSISMWKR